jgi:hypothetical protein
MSATGDHGGEVEGDVTPGTRWMTYRELADFLGVEEESGRRRAQRARWPRRPGNDGKTRVGVPGDVTPDDTRKPARDDAGDDAGDVTPALVALTERQATELARQHERAGRAEGEAAALRDAVAREVARADQADAARQAAEDERDNLATEIIKERERRARAEGDAAAARAERDTATADTARERDRAEGALIRASAFEAEVKGLREALEEARRPFWRRWIG